MHSQTVTGNTIYSACTKYWSLKALIGKPKKYAAQGSTFVGWLCFWKDHGQKPYCQFDITNLVDYYSKISLDCAVLPNSIIDKILHFPASLVNFIVERASVLNCRPESIQNGNSFKLEFDLKSRKILKKYRLYCIVQHLDSKALCVRSIQQNVSYSLVHLDKLDRFTCIWAPNFKQLLLEVCCDNETKMSKFGETHFMAKHTEKVGAECRVSSGQL